MGTEVVNFKVFYGGHFDDSDGNTYVWGSNSLYERVDVDLLCMFHMEEMAMDMGYQKNKWAFFYKNPWTNSIIHVQGDFDLLEMVEKCKGIAVVELYMVGLTDNGGNGHEVYGENCGVVDEVMLLGWDQSVRVYQTKGSNGILKENAVGDNNDGGNYGKSPLNEDSVNIPAHRESFDVGSVPETHNTTAHGESSGVGAVLKTHAVDIENSSNNGDVDSNDENDEEVKVGLKKIRDYNKRQQAEHQDTDSGEDLTSDEDDSEEDEQHGGIDPSIPSVNVDDCVPNESDLGSYSYNSDGVNSDGQTVISTRRRTSKTDKYDPTSTCPDWHLGLAFENAKQFREAVCKYSITKSLPVKYVINKSYKIRVQCQAKCPWLLYASLNKKSGNIVVKTYVSTHTCRKKNINSFVTYRFIAAKYKDRILSQPNIPIKELQKLVRQEYKVNVSLFKCKRAKRKVLMDSKKLYIEEYARLHDYAEELRRSNPGTTAFANYYESPIEKKNTFKRFYLCFHCCRVGWVTGCRPIIGLDGTWLKGPCKGELLTAVGRDGNDQMYLIAWAVVEVENNDNWEWFIRMLCEDLNIQSGTKITFISDMQKGLSKAIENVIPGAEHRWCARHIYAQWSKDFRGGDKKKQFYATCRSSYQEHFRDMLDQLNALAPGSVEKLLAWPLERWCKAFFRPNSKCDAIDNNICESFNGWILEARCKPIISMLEQIRLQVFNRIIEKKNWSCTWKGNIGPKVMQRLEKNIEEGEKCEVVYNADPGFEVMQGLDRHTVNIEELKCTCREWELTGIPCCHGCKAFDEVGKNPADFIAIWYHKSYYENAYRFIGQPVAGSKLWPKSNLDPLFPPLVRVMPGRPKKKRKREPGEPRVGKASWNERQGKCSICKRTGHNKQSCQLKGNVGKDVPTNDNVQVTEDQNFTEVDMTQPEEFGTQQSTNLEDRCDGNDLRGYAGIGRACGRSGGRAASRAHGRLTGIGVGRSDNASSWGIGRGRGMMAGMTYGNEGIDVVQYNASTMGISRGCGMMAGMKDGNDVNNVNEIQYNASSRGSCRGRGKSNGVRGGTRGKKHYPRGVGYYHADDGSVIYNPGHPSERIISEPSNPTREIGQCQYSSDFQKGVYYGYKAERLKWTGRPAVTRNQLQQEALDKSRKKGKT